MESKFQMDFILGNKTSTGNNFLRTTKGCDLSDDNMLPDSSLSPSQIFEKNANHETDAKVLVTDVFGNQFSVYEKHLISESNDKLKPKENDSKITDFNDIKVESALTDQVDTNEDLVDKMSAEYDEVSDNESLKEITEAAHLAYIEWKIDKLEKELNKMSGSTLTAMDNSAQNLKFVELDHFNMPPIKIKSYTEENLEKDRKLQYSLYEAEELDRNRKMRMKDIYERFSEINKWVRANKRKLNQLEKTNSYLITDFSSKNITKMPYPEFTNSSNSLYISALDQSDNNHNQTTNQFITLNQLYQSEDNDDYKNLTFHKTEPTEDQSQKSELVTNCPTDLREESIRHNSDKSHSTSSRSTSSSRTSSSHDDSCLKCMNCKNRIYHENDDSIIIVDRNPPTPDLRRPELDSNDISEGIRVLLLQNNYFRAGIILPPITDELCHRTSDDEGGGGGGGEAEKDNNNNNQINLHQRMWRVRLDSDNNRRQDVVVLSEWQLLEQGVREIIPTSTSQLIYGTRVCANWSQQLTLNLYPGTVSSRHIKNNNMLTQLNRNKSYETCDECKNLLKIEFDDGDHKEVCLEQVRLLPENFPNLHELLAEDSKLTVGILYANERDLHLRRNSYTSSNNVSQKRPYKRKESSTSTEISNLILQKKKKRPKTEMVLKSVPKINKKKKVEWSIIKKDNCNLSPVLVRNIDDLSITTGDDIQLLSYSRYSVYVGRVEQILAKSKAPEMNFKMKWYYHLNDCICYHGALSVTEDSTVISYGLDQVIGSDGNKLIKRMKKSKLAKHLLFQTNHIDVNDIYSVVRKIQVISFDEFYNKYLIENNSSSKSSINHNQEPPDNVFLLAGHYDQQEKCFNHLTPSLIRYLCKIEKI